MCAHTRSMCVHAQSMHTHPKEKTIVRYGCNSFLLRKRGVRLARVDWGRSRNHKIVPLYGRTSLTTRVWGRSLGKGMGSCYEPNPT